MVGTIITLVYSGRKQGHKDTLIGPSSPVGSAHPHASRVHFPSASLVAELVKNLPAMWETWV